MHGGDGMTQKIFIDTEFTDFVDIHLISLGMAADTYEEFYVEVPYPDHACSAFVREVVLPRLHRDPDVYCPLVALRGLILNWLHLVRRTQDPIEICFDYPSDWDLFVTALDGRVPDWIRPRNVDREASDLLRESFFAQSALKDPPETRHHEHHALSDALALRYAFRELSPVMTS
jgi:hypothetical protein